MHHETFETSPVAHPHGASASVPPATVYVSKRIEYISPSDYVLRYDFFGVKNGTRFRICTARDIDESFDTEEGLKALGLIVDRIL